MGSDWKEYSLEELCDFTNGFAFKSGDYIPITEDTLEVFRMGYIERGGGFKEDSTPVFVPKNYGKDLTKFFLKSGDITIAMTDMKDRVAILGNTARIRDNHRFVVNQRVGCIRVKRQDLVDPLFLYYYSNHKPHVEELRSRANSGVQVNLSTAAIKACAFFLPPLPEQKAIAQILGTLDDKIELNRRMNATLEGMAQALFKSWFVDFDPVIDNALAAGNPIPDELADRAEVRRQALANGTANREAAKPFPDAFQQTESMGWIPQGWEIQPLYDIANFVNGAAYKGADFSDSPDALPVIKIAEIKAGVTAQTKFTEINKGDRYRINDGDILLSWSGNPDTSIDTFIWTDGPGYLNQHIFNVCLHDESERYFVYYQLKHLRATFAEIARDKQTTGLGHFTAGDMKRLMVFKPSVSLLEQFNTTVSSINLRGYENLLATKTLTKLRDSLLPKLISGEIQTT